MGVIICLFLSGVLFICDGLHVLSPSGPLIVKLGGSVMLPCYVEAPIPLEELEVEWKRTDSETLVHLFQDRGSQPEFQDQAYSGRASFFTEEVERGNFSLLLINLTTKDAGVYRCSVYRQQETGQTSVEIKEIERLIVTGGHVVSAYAGEDITMNCSVDSNVPPERLEVLWKTVDQQIPVLFFEKGEVQTESTHERYSDRVEFFSPEERQKGNFSLRLKDLRTEDKGHYICEVFSGDFSANTTVEVLQLDDSRRALAVQYTLVCCPNIAMCLAFILWGVTEGFYREVATCSTLNLMRILSLFWIAPYLDTFKENLQRFIKRSTISLEYAVITAFSYPGLTSIIKNEGLINYHLTEVINFGRGVVIVVIYDFVITNVMLAWLPILTVCFSFCRCQGLFNRGSKVLIWMAVLLILEVISTSSTVYIQNVSLQTHKERGGLTCVAAYLHILTGMLFFNALFYVYDKSHVEKTRRSVEFDSTVTEPQRTSGRAIVYMLGAVGLSFVNSVALAVELILKARNGERTVEDLRVILVPSECIFAICCLMLQISAFWRTNRENLMDDLRDLCQLCGCKQASVDSPVHNHELQAIQSTEAALAPDVS